VPRQRRKNHTQKKYIPSGSDKPGGAKKAEGWISVRTEKPKRNYT